MKCNDVTKAVQYRLKELGYYQGYLDGETGPMTSNAVIQFKQDNGLRARDFVGPLTLAILFDKDTKAKAPVKSDGKTPAWIVEARNLIGTNEYRGAANNPKIIGWAKDLDQWYPDDSTAWCGLFVAHCMSVGAPDEPQDFNRLGAREWLKFGEKVPKSYGAIAIFWRGSKSGWKGHVGFLVGEDRDTYHILGGNQSDSVNVTRISKSRLLGFRGPEGWVGETNLQSVADGKISVNES